MHVVGWAATAQCVVAAHGIVGSISTGIAVHIHIDRTAILANLLLRPGDPAKSSYEELDHLIRCIDDLSIGAIHVLGAARTIALGAETRGLRPDPRRTRNRRG